MSLVFLGGREWLIVYTRAPRQPPWVMIDAEGRPLVEFDGAQPPEDVCEEVEAIMPKASRAVQAEAAVASECRRAEAPPTITVMAHKTALIGSAAAIERLRHVRHGLGNAALARVVSIRCNHRAYTVVVLFSWPVLVMAALGLADAVFGLRQRYLQSRPPPLPVA